MLGRDHHGAKAPRHPHLRRRRALPRPGPSYLQFGAQTSQHEADGAMQRPGPHAAIAAGRRVAMRPLSWLVKRSARFTLAGSGAIKHTHDSCGCSLNSTSNHVASSDALNLNILILSLPCIRRLVASRLLLLLLPVVLLCPPPPVPHINQNRDSGRRLFRRQPCHCCCCLGVVPHLVGGWEGWSKGADGGWGG